jgi:hypothetical protein
MTDPPEVKRRRYIDNIDIIGLYCQVSSTPTTVTRRFNDLGSLTQQRIEIGELAARN